MCPLVGPGLGLRLLIKRLLPMYGHRNHKVFETNSFFSDEELRKVVEEIAAAIIQTAQGRPTGQRQSIREDLLKKLITAELLTGRVPYAIFT